jgi:CHAT domain-containing protein/tetratricopeptide (TPR) repeat protein
MSFALAMLERRNILFVTRLLVTSCLLFGAPALAAQTASASKPQAPAGPTPEPTAQIDQLLKEAGEAQTNEQLTELERKAKEALALSQKAGDKNRMARSLGYLGAAEFYGGRLQDALEHHKHALEAAVETGNKRYSGVAMQNIGATLSALGQYDEALYYFNRTLELGKELNERLGLWHTIRNVGVLYSQLGEYDKSEAEFKEALAIAREFKRKPFEEASLIALIELKIQTAQYQVAHEYCQQALEIDAEVKNPGLHLEVLALTAKVADKLGDPHRALEIYKQTLELAHAIGNQFVEAGIMSNIGETQQSLGRLSDALDSQLRARAILRQTGPYSYPEVESYIDWKIALAHEAMQHDDEAVTVLHEAVSAIERIRANAVPTESSMASVNASRRAVFVDLIRLLMKLGREHEALEIAESYRARAFLDLLAVSRINLRADLTATQRQREDGIFDEISAIQKELMKVGITAERQTALQGQLAAAENKLDALHLELRRENPRYSAAQHPEPVRVSRVQRNLLDSETALIEYLLGDKQSFAWVVAQNRLSVAILPSRKEIESQVRNYLQTLTRKVSELTVQGDLTSYQSASQKLYATLIRPLEGFISSNRRLFIVPDGVLAYLPFETLVKSGQFESRSAKSAGKWRGPQLLLERFSITYVPSASALAAIKSRKHETTPSAKDLLAFGDPVYDRNDKNGSASATSGGSRAPLNPRYLARSSYAERGFEFTQLPNTRAEVLEIRNLFPQGQSRVFLGSDAREEIVKAEKLDQYALLHFAAHALIDDRFPGRSGIVLSLSNDSNEDGVLQMREIMRLKVNARLVTLSACSTGLGKLYDGEGIVGLTRAFLYAGADSVIVSLWNVNDYGTADLMKGFYKNLAHGMTKDEALRKAKVAMLKGHGKWRHPYFWAPFVLIGDR